MSQSTECLGSVVPLAMFLLMFYQLHLNYVSSASTWQTWNECISASGKRSQSLYACDGQNIALTGQTGKRQGRKRSNCYSKRIRSTFVMAWFFLFSQTDLKKENIQRLKWHFVILLYCLIINISMYQCSLVSM